MARVTRLDLHEIDPEWAVMNPDRVRLATGNTEELTTAVLRRVTTSDVLPEDALRLTLDLLPTKGVWRTDEYHDVRFDAFANFINAISVANWDGHGGTLEFYRRDAADDRQDMSIGLMRAQGDWSVMVTVESLIGDIFQDEGPREKVPVMLRHAVVSADRMYHAGDTNDG